MGVCERTFRRYVDRYEDEGLDGLMDKRLGQVSARRTPVDEVVRTETLYRERYDGWNVKHFYSFYRRRHGGERSYTWVKNTLQRTVHLLPQAIAHLSASGESPQPSTESYVDAPLVVTPDIVAERYEQGATIVTSNLDF